MGVLAMATADLRDASVQLYPGNSASFISSTYKRTGTYSFRVYYSYEKLSVSPGGTGVSELYGRICWYTNAASAKPFIQLLATDTTSGEKPQIAIIFEYSTGSLSVFRGDASTGVLIGSVAGFGTSAWICMEFRALIHATTGIMQIKINGDLVIDYAGNTVGATTSASNKIHAVRVSCDSVNYVWVDDVILRDDQWPGRGGIYVLTPNAGTATENWTASAGDPEACVDELPPSFTDYITTDASTDGTQHLFAMSDLPISSPTAINAVGVVAKAKTDVSGQAFIKTLLKSDTTVSAGESTGVEATEGWFSTFYATDPATSGAWSESAVNALQAGVESDVP